MRVEVSGLSKAYQTPTSRIEVLKDLDFKSNAGENVAILGPSGSGKTTFLSLMAGLDIPDLGQIHIGDLDMVAMNENERTAFRSQNIGIVFQQFHLIPNLTAMENVSLPLDISGDERSLDKARAILERVGLGHRLSHFPSELSGGECQRVAIARALVVEPKLLLADEPSGNLDQKTGDMVMDTLFEIVGGLDTVLLLVTHDEELASRCSRVLKLKDGKLN